VRDTTAHQENYVTDYLIGPTAAGFCRDGANPHTEAARDAREFISPATPGSSNRGGCGAG
jgi:hypothetical protein